MSDQTATGVIVPVRAPQFIEIVEEGTLLDWQFTHPDTKETWASKFQVRIVPNDVQRTLKDKYTKPDFRRGQKFEDFNWPLWLDDCLDYAIVGWSDVKSRGADLPCERKYKLLLPEMVKQELVRLCIGRELGEIQSGLVGHAEGAGSGPRRPSKP